MLTVEKITRIATAPLTMSKLGFTVDLAWISNSAGATGGELRTDGVDIDLRAIF
jgi:hypothetical protein